MIATQTNPHSYDFASLQSKIKGEILTDDYSLGMYSTDASFYQLMPLAIVLPMDEADVKAAVKFANDHHLKILPRGGGTSLAGQTVGEALIIDFSKYMNQVWYGMYSTRRWPTMDCIMLLIPRLPAGLMLVVW